MRSAGSGPPSRRSACCASWTPLLATCSPGVQSGIQVQWIPFGWDHDLFNTYEITRLATASYSSGDYQIQMINADPAVPPVVPVRVGAGLLAAVGVARGFYWGMDTLGGGASVWQSVHAVAGTPVTFTGQFLPPLAQSGDPANSVIHTGKNGRVIPVEAQIRQGGTEITDSISP